MPTSLQLKIIERKFNRSQQTLRRSNEIESGAREKSARDAEGAKSASWSDTEKPTGFTDDLADTFLRSCRQHAQRIAVVEPEGPFSYRQLEALATAFAMHLIRTPSFQAGGHVGLYLENSIEYIAAFYGTLLADGVVVPISRSQKFATLKSQMDFAEVQTLVVPADEDLVFEDQWDKESYSALSKPPGDFDLNVRVVELTDENWHGESLRNRLGDADFVGRIVTRIDSIDQKKGCESGWESRSLAGGKRDRPAMMIFTSGSTGQPKAVLLSHRNLLANQASIRACLPIDSHERTYAMLPFVHAFGNSVMQTHLLSGAALVIDTTAKFPAEILGGLRQNRCTSFSTIPDLAAAVFLNFPTAHRLPDLKYVAVAGGPLMSSLAIKMDGNLGQAKLFLMYGQTEATARICCLPAESLTTAAITVGRPIPGVDLKIVDEQGNEVGNGVQGTLFARGENVMLGYWNDPAATAAAIQDDWLNTGDLAVQHANGMIEIVGRKSGLLKINGNRCHPQQIENMVAAKLPGVKIAIVPFEFFSQTRLALFAMPDDGSFESEHVPMRRHRDFAPTVAVESSEASESHAASAEADTLDATGNRSRLNASQLRGVCRRVLPPSLVPQQFRVVRQWPVNAAGKLDRLRLRAILDERPCRSPDSLPRSKPMERSSNNQSAETAESLAAKSALSTVRPT